VHACLMPTVAVRARVYVYRYTLNLAQHCIRLLFF
jgi:hypothetical protein